MFWRWRNQLVFPPCAERTTGGKQTAGEQRGAAGKRRRETPSGGAAIPAPPSHLHLLVRVFPSPCSTRSALNCLLSHLLSVSLLLAAERAHSLQGVYKDTDTASCRSRQLEDDPETFITLNFQLESSFTNSLMSCDVSIHRDDEEDTCHGEVDAPSSLHAIRTLEQKHKEAPESRFNIDINCFCTNQAEWAQSMGAWRPPEVDPSTKHHHLFFLLRLLQQWGTS
ncbi:hypothetical protein D5F01_LYC16101 [Larimichthys crocea]|uniref:Uncharacterized protein n=1 Tax=Larimichthys crocea TaxID=215358 RepID=A0A6G0I559_LARCR|nr:hypothetical protein D5F01_LYC16101 [Larimichthys crocea]